MQKIEDCESKEEIFSLTPTHERYEPNDCILGSECIACGILYLCGWLRLYTILILFRVFRNRKSFCLILSDKVAQLPSCGFYVVL